MNPLVAAFLLDFLFDNRFEQDKQRMLTPDTEPLRSNEPYAGDAPYHKGHKCPACGEKQSFCREGAFDTRHSHVCWKCKTKWQHDPTPPGEVDETLL